MNKVITGIERRGERLFSARVRLQSGRPTVEGLNITVCDDINETASGGDSKIAIAISDSNAIIKSLQVPPDKLDDGLEIVRFELLESLLGSPERYVASVHATRLPHRFLGIAWPTEKLPLKRYDGAEFYSRAFALGKGYLGFCRVCQGELVAIVDVVPDALSICIIYQKEVIDIGFLPSQPDRSATEEKIDRLGIDIMTLLNHKLSLLTSEGISLPLSAIVISGHGIDEKTRNRLTNFFPTGVLSPDLHRGYFASGVLESTEFFSDYLVALGLALN